MEEMWSLNPSGAGAFYICQGVGFAFLLLEEKSPHAQNLFNETLEECNQAWSSLPRAQLWTKHCTSEITLNKKINMYFFRFCMRKPENRMAKSPGALPTARPLLLQLELGCHRLFWSIVLVTFIASSLLGKLRFLWAKVYFLIFCL